MFYRTRSPKMFNIRKFYLQFLFTVLVYPEIKGLQLTSIKVPQIIDYHDTATLSCSYHMGSHKLNSVKWYKDGSEFFRYSPANYPSVQKFNTTGITLAANQLFNCNKETCTIKLVNMTAQSSGSYKCEVSGDAPDFKITADTVNMTVAALPKSDPVINLAKSHLKLDEILIANCTADKSSPAAKLYWYINDELAASDQARPPQDVALSLGSFKLHYRTIELDLILDKAKFANKKSITIKCVAKIDNYPEMTRESTFVLPLNRDTSMNQKLTGSHSSPLTSRGCQNYYIIIFILSIIMSIT